VPNGHGPSGSAVVNGARAMPAEPGSKIFLSNLPQDVGETEVSDLMKKTIGALRDIFIIYNSQGLSKGMAVVHFVRPGDAALAKEKYHGKVIDGRKAIRIEILVDNINTASASAPALLRVAQPPKPKSLFDRIQGQPAQDRSLNQRTVTFAPAPQVHQQAPARQRPVPAQNPSAVQQGFAATRTRAKLRTKKGPRRVKKSVADLDKEMEQYRQEAEEAGVPGYHV